MHSNTTILKVDATYYGLSIHVGPFQSIIRLRRNVVLKIASKLVVAEYQ